MKQFEKIVCRINIQNVILICKDKSDEAARKNIENIFEKIKNEIEDDKYIKSIFNILGPFKNPRTNDYYRYSIMIKINDKMSLNKDTGETKIDKNIKNFKNFLKKLSKYNIHFDVDPVKILNNID